MQNFLYQKRDVNTVLADVIKHLTPDRAFEDAYPQVTRTLFWGGKWKREHSVLSLFALYYSIK